MGGKAYGKNTQPLQPDPDSNWDIAIPSEHLIKRLPGFICP
jgi:hypothetical protein